MGGLKGLWPSDVPAPDVVVTTEVNLSAYSDLLAIVEAAKDLIVYRPVGETAIEDGLINHLALRLNTWEARK